MFTRFLASAGGPSNSIATAATNNAPLVSDGNRPKLHTSPPISHSSFSLNLGKSNSPVLAHHHSLIPHINGLICQIINLSNTFCHLRSLSPWPPHERIVREAWINNIQYPILPPGYESKVTLARIYYPTVHLRIPIMGPQYMKAMSILSDQKSDDVTSSWYMPDIDESVNFDHTAS